MLFNVNPETKAVAKVQAGSFVALGVWERRDIEQWIVQEPDLLDEPLLIITSEFSRFDRSNDRLDVMALDEQGSLVVVELKRDQVGGHADLQALRYAAMVSTLRLEDVAKEYAKFRTKHGQETTEAEATQAIRAFITIEDPTELANFELGGKPRIILASEDFSAEITTTVLWLATFEVQIKCVRLTPYQLDGKLLISSQTVIPLPEAGQFQVGIHRKEEAQARQRARRQNTTSYLLEQGLLTAGQKLLLRRNLPVHVPAKPDDPRFEAEVTGETGNRFMKWGFDGKLYAISRLTWEIFRDQHPDKVDPGGVNGNIYWVMAEDGPTLWELMEQHQRRNAGDPEP